MYKIFIYCFTWLYMAMCLTCIEVEPLFLLPTGVGLSYILLVTIATESERRRKRVRHRQDNPEIL